MITYVKGDATRPVGPGPWMVAHVVNDIGVYGAGFSGAVLKRWPHVYKDFKKMELGTVDFRLARSIYSPEKAWLDPDRIVVAHMCAQKGVGTNKVRIQYHMLADCLSEIKMLSDGDGFSIHMPRIGCGLAGGDWQVVEEIIDSVELDCTVYDL